MAVWTLVTGSPCGWAYELPPTQPHGFSVCELKWAVWQWLGKTADWHPQNRPSYLLDYWTTSLLRYPFGEHSHGTQISSLFFAPFWEVYPHPLPNFLVISFPITYFSGLSWQTTGPSAWNIHSHAPGHFPSKQSTAKGRAQRSSHWKACPSLLSFFRDVPKVCRAAAVHSASDACISHRTVCKPGPSLFLTLSTGLQDLLLESQVWLGERRQSSRRRGHHGHSSHFLCVPYLCLQGLLSPAHLSITSTWQQSIAVHDQLYGLWSCGNLVAHG